MMNKTSAIFGMIVALVIGFVAGNYVNMNKEGGGGSGHTASLAAAPDSSVERFKVPIGNAAVTGPANAKVTIIEYSDYQCPFCSRAETTMEEVKKHYGNEVRIAYKHNPLPFHPNAGPAARAALAAREQGNDKFWAFHSLLFKNQDKLDSATYEAHARTIGLNEAKFKSDLEQNRAKYEAQIEADKKEAAQFGASGTPAFFINGRFLSGAQPFDAFKKIIDEELSNADKALKAGASRDNLYATMTQNGKDRAAPPSDQKQRPQPAPDNNTVYKVALGNAPVRGPATAKVTIVEFSDFQCPYCSRVTPTIDKVVETYGKDVRVAFKQNPLPMHNNAVPAAQAALAANEQGKFWQMHDKLFGNQQALDRPSLEKYAADIGLDVNKFKAALDSNKFKQQISDDQAEAARFGARGTPSFFINGKPFKGAQPFEAFKAVIDKELEAANAKLKAGVAPANLYAEIIKNGQDKVSEAPARPAQAEPSDNVVYKAVIGDAPVKGPKDARVTIVAFSDFQCPYCSRVEPALAKVEETFPKDVRIAFKQLPLPFHDKAHLAAEASLAAYEQGKFWPMHDKLFANQGALDRPSLEKYAQELGLNMDKFKAALDSGKFKAKVDQERSEGNKLGANGTPSFFINGKSFVGAQPFEAFKAKIEAALADADALIKAKRLRPGQVYDELMKDAKSEVAAAPAAAAKADGDEIDKTVYKVDPGNGPAWGDAKAPVTIVEFSDFQCPFCSRVVPTVTKIKENFKGKVRIVWRNYPLPFHQNAAPAAEAAMAANEQGKFWEMHDKLFANQGALDRPSLEKYAGEIGLDVAKFKAALDSGKFKDAVNADVQYGNSLPGGGMGTPSFFINGRKIAGAYPYETFEKVIKEALN